MCFTISPKENGPYSTLGRVDMKGDAKGGDIVGETGFESAITLSKRSLHNLYASSSLYIYTWRKRMLIEGGDSIYLQ